MMMAAGILEQLALVDEVFETKSQCLDRMCLQPVSWCLELAVSHLITQIILRNTSNIHIQQHERVTRFTNDISAHKSHFVLSYTNKNSV